MVNIVQFGKFLKIGSMLALLCFLAAHSDASERLRDPTLPLAYQAKAKAKKALVLQAIYERSSGNEAVINGKRVVVGSSLGQVRVTKITKDKVYIREGESVRSLSLRASIFTAP